MSERAPSKAERDERRAAALRENLKRRKAGTKPPTPSDAAAAPCVDAPDDP